MSKRLADSEQEFQAGCCPSKRRSVQDSATSSSSSSSDDTAFSPCEPPAASSRAVGGAAACPPLFPLASLVHAAAEEQGARPYMEDAHAALELPAGARSYAVFDGHGGAAVADFCAAHLLPRLAAEARAGAGRAGAAPSYPASLRAAFAAVDSELAAGRRAHVCGSTAAVCVVTPEWLFAGNAGDSRVVLVRSDRPLPLTIDHSPARPDERERVCRAGGQVMWQNGLRVMGALSMTRAIGDHFLRPHGVIAEPEVSAVRRSAADEFLILATDGLWNWIGPADASDVARRAAARSEAAGLGREAGAGVAARALTRLALARGSSDNVTVMVVDLRPPPEGAAAAPAPGGLIASVPSLLRALLDAEAGAPPEVDAWAAPRTGGAAGPAAASQSARTVVGTASKWESPFSFVGAQGSPFGEAGCQLRLPALDASPPEEPEASPGTGPEAVPQWGAPLPQRPKSATSAARGHGSGSAGAAGEVPCNAPASRDEASSLVHRARSAPPVAGHTVTTGGPTGCSCSATGGSRGGARLGPGCGALQCVDRRVQALLSMRTAGGSGGSGAGSLFTAALGLVQAVTAASSEPAPAPGALQRMDAVAVPSERARGQLQHPSLLRRR